MSQKRTDFKIEREELFRSHKRVMLWSSMFVLVVGCFAAYFGAQSQAVRELGRAIAWPLQFSLRDHFERAPDFHPNLKVIMFDDSTVESLKRPYLNFSEWASVLSYLESHNPASIYVDKIFGVVDGDVAEVRNSLPKLRMLRTRVSAGVYSSPVRIPGRPSLDLTSSQFSVKKYLPESYANVADEAVEAIISKSKIRDISSRMVYGPTPELRNVFVNGHIDWPTAHEIFPLYRYGFSSLMPALSLSGNINLRVESNGISAMGSRIPLTSDGSMLINWLRPDVMYRNSLTLLDVVNRMNSGVKWSRIPENAHIVILPEAYTGSADFVTSPYGPALGGMVHASVLNSVLSKKMLIPKHNSFLYFALLVFLAVALQRLRGISSWFALFFITALVVVLALLQFVFLSQDVPWVFGGSLFLLSGVSVLSVRSFGEKKMTALLLNLEKENERLSQEELRLSNEMAEAAKIARALIPDDAPDWPNYWVSGFHKSASDLSGDWYFFEKSSSGRYGHFVMCDITGHGVQAAIVVSCCKTILTSLRIEKSSLFDTANFGQEYAARLNSVLYQHGQGSHSTTLLSLTVDFYEGALHIVNCGHTFPVWHQQGEKSWQALLPPKLNDPLGFSKDIKIENFKKQIERGDSLIVYSDGTSLNRHRRIVRRYFEELDSGIQISAKKLSDALRKESQRRGLKDPNDDVSLVIFKRLR